MRSGQREMGSGERGTITESGKGLAQSVERLTAEREVAGLILGAGPILRVLK